MVQESEPAIVTRFWHSESYDVIENVLRRELEPGKVLFSGLIRPLAGALEMSFDRALISNI